MDTPKLERRGFIGTSTALCCTLAGLFAARATAKSNETDRAMPSVPPEELVAYCGLYCGACDIYQKRIGTSGKELKRLLEVFEFPEYAHLIPGLEQYDAFSKTLDALIMIVGECQGCPKGGGNPDCAIRLCAKEKGYATCAECAEVKTCEKLKILGNSYTMIQGHLDDIKSTGPIKWAQTQQKMVDNGFRLSNKKEELRKTKSE